MTHARMAEAAINASLDAYLHGAQEGDVNQARSLHDLLDKMLTERETDEGRYWLTDHARMLLAEMHRQLSHCEETGKALSDHVMDAVRLIQLLAGGAGCLLVYWLGKRCFDPTVGLLSATLTAIYAPLIMFQGTLLYDQLGAFLVPASFAVAMAEVQGIGAVTSLDSDRATRSRYTCRPTSMTSWSTRRMRSSSSVKV